jgi:hypothetical protein
LLSLVPRGSGSLGTTALSIITYFMFEPQQILRT